MIIIRVQQTEQIEDNFVRVREVDISLDDTAIKKIADAITKIQNTPCSICGGPKINHQGNHHYEPARRAEYI